MANNYSLVPTIRFNTIDTNLAVVDTVVDAIRAVDVPAIQAAIAALSLLSPKEKSLLGIGALPGFRSYFDKVADGAAPDDTVWTLIVTGGGTVTVQNDTANKNGFLICASGAGADDDAIACSKDKRIFSIKAPVTTLHMVGRAKFVYTNHAAITDCLGFVANEKALTECGSFRALDAYAAAFVTYSNVPYACTSDGAVIEETNLGVWIITGTWFNFEIVISVTDVKFYINGTLRATHAARVPSSVWQMAVGATQNGEAETVYIEYMDVTGE